MMLLESDVEFGGNLGHAQSAPNNFLGIHLHDTQYYLKVGAWVAPDLHSRYAHGNVLMWHKAAHSPWYTNKSTGYWATRSARGLMPDNMGGGWIASSTCDQVVESVEGAWVRPFTPPPPSFFFGPPTFAFEPHFPFSGYLVLRGSVK